MLSQYMYLKKFAHPSVSVAYNYCCSPSRSVLDDRLLYTVYLLIYWTLFWAIFVVLIQRTLQCFNITISGQYFEKLSYIHRRQVRLRVLQLDSFE